MSELAQVLRQVLPVDDPNVLVGHATGDDAAVYRLSDERALVVTADFFTPIVDDPFDFGRIAATNALSDVYAMGARPLFALNLVGFPRKLLPEGILGEILRGGSTVTASVGIPTIGGHSIDDAEPKYGLVVIGEVHPDRMVTNAGGRPGDQLLLTKPLGSGIIATAIKKGDAGPDVIAEAVEVMATLNAAAAEVMSAVGAHAGTDVTGFGLLGHLRAMARASGTAARIDASAVPVLRGARELAAAGHVPGGTRRNLEDVAEDVAFGEDVDDVTALLLVDAQTSGGILMSVAPERVEEALSALVEAGVPAASLVGALTEGPAGRVDVT
jgi:selenide,water dikinase